MADPKTLPTDQPFEDFVAKLPEARRKPEAAQLCEIMTRVTGAAPVVWSGNMVGFGQYDYTYKSGRSGTWFLTGFRPAKARLSIYVMEGFSDHADALARLGPHKHSVSCLYVTSLARIDLGVLEGILRQSTATMRRLYPSKP